MTANALLAHRLEGDGPPLLLLNGGLMTYAAWEPVAAHLSKHYRLVLCDLRGQLLSCGPAPLDLTANVTDLTALLDHLGIESTHVLATSYGGEIGLLLAALQPERVRTLIAATVCDRATEALQRGREELSAILAEGFSQTARGRLHDRIVAEVYSEAFKKRFAAGLAARRRQISALPQSWFVGLESIIAASGAFNLRTHLSSIRCPTLIVLAADDQVMPSESSRAVAAAISGAETRVHPTSGHALVAEEPEWLARIAHDFLARHASAGTTAPPARSARSSRQQTDG